MNKKILWIDDDYDTIQSMFYYIKKAGFKIDFAISAHEGYSKLLNWQQYDLIVVDLILPISNQQDSIPMVVQSWKTNGENGHVGINLIKWMVNEKEIKCPIVILSIVPDPISIYGIKALNLAGQIQKESLSPLDLKEQIFKILKIQNEK